MKKSIILLLLGVLTLMPSCLVTRTGVQTYNEVQGTPYLYAKGRQCYLFWGLLPLGWTSVATPADQPCQVRTRTGFVDGLVTTLTAGIFTMQQVRVYAKRPKPAQEAFSTGDVVTVKAGGKYQKGTIDSIIDGENCIVKMENGKLKKINFEKLSK